MTISPSKIAVGVVLATVLIPSLAFAADKAQYCRGQAGYALGAGLKTGTLSQMITYGDCQANFRTTDLSAATTRLSQMQHLSVTTLAALQQRVSGATASIATAKGKFDSDSATTTALADVRSMYTGVRVYALVLPQVWITAASDRAMTASGLLAQVQTTLQNALTASGSVNTANLQQYLNDMTAKLADANTQATAAQSGVVNLAPDNGDATIMANNKAAIMSARASVGAAQTDLQAARQDAQTVRQALGL